MTPATDPSPLDPSPLEPSPLEHGPLDPAALDPAAPADHPHNFEVQKELHRRIRNDPDYDDWDYGTEPLPHEAWVPPSGEADPTGT